MTMTMNAEEGAVAAACFIKEPGVFWPKDPGLAFILFLWKTGDDGT